jgi:molecular chaperone DnaK (HSP70)
MTRIAIDFGNRNTAIARWNVATNQPELINIARVGGRDSQLIPSLLYIQNARAEAGSDGCLIGQQVIDRGKLTPHPRLFQQIKRHLSTQIGFNPRFDQQEISPELAGSLFLKKLFTLVRSQQIEVSQLIFTVPILAQERYLHWLQRCSQQITPQTPCLMVDEPLAAALGYAIAEPGSLILVIDFGAGTLDLALIRLPRENSSERSSGQSFNQQVIGKIEVIAKVGALLGGEEIDRWLVEDYCQNFHHQNQDCENQDCHNQQELGIAETNLLYSLMEKIKIQLSTQDSAQEILFNSSTLECEEITYQRSQLEQILNQKGFYRNLQSLLEEVIHRAKTRGILKIDIQQIVMVGGTCLIPSVQEVIANYFRSDRCHSSDPFGAVVKGALFLSNKTAIKDTLIHGYALRYWQNDPPQWNHQLIFPRSQIYPTQQPREIILSASQPQQSHIELIIGEVYQHQSGLPEIILSGDRLITIEVKQNRTEFVPVSDACKIPLDPPSNPGSDRLQLQFQINNYRQLCLTVFDLLTEKRLIYDQIIAELK